MAPFFQVTRKAITGILRQIEAERKGNTIDRNQVYELLKMLDLLSLYETQFQSLFMEESNMFYQDEGSEQLRTLDTPAYLEHCSVQYLNPEI